MDENAAAALLADLGVTLRRIEGLKNKRTQPAGAEITGEAVKQRGNGFVHDPLPRVTGWMILQTRQSSQVLS